MIDDAINRIVLTEAQIDELKSSLWLRGIWELPPEDQQAVREAFLETPLGQARLRLDVNNRIRDEAMKLVAREDETRWEEIRAEALSKCQGDELKELIDQLYNNAVTLSRDEMIDICESLEHKRRVLQVVQENRDELRRELEQLRAAKQ